MLTSVNQESHPSPFAAFRVWLRPSEFDAKRDQTALRVLWFIGFVFLLVGLPVYIFLNDPLPLIGAMSLLSVAYKTHRGFKDTARKAN
jgi:hypothetical protein